MSEAARALSIAVALAVSVTTGQSQALRPAPRLSKADGFSIGVFGASRAFQSTVDGERGSMLTGTSYGGVIHVGASPHAGIALRVQRGTLKNGDPETTFAQADVTFRYTFREDRSLFRPFFDLGVAGYAERTQLQLGNLEQRAGFLTLALGGQVHLSRDVALEVVWSAAGGTITGSRFGGRDIGVATNTQGAGGLSLGLVWHPTFARSR